MWLINYYHVAMYFVCNAYKNAYYNKKIIINVLNVDYLLIIFNKFMYE